MEVSRSKFPPNKRPLYTVGARVMAGCMRVTELIYRRDSSDGLVPQGDWSGLPLGDLAPFQTEPGLLERLVTQLEEAGYVSLESAPVAMPGGRMVSLVCHATRGGGQVHLTVCEAFVLGTGRGEGEEDAAFKKSFDHAAVGMAHVDLQGRFLRVNGMMAAITGYTLEELAGMTFQDITHPQDLGADLDCFHQTLAGEIDRYTMEKRYIKKGGAIVWVCISCSLIRDGGPEPYFLAVVENIQGRKVVEEALRESESRFRALADAAPVLIWMADTEQKCTYLNQPWLLFTGRTLLQELGDGWAKGVHPSDLGHWHETFSNAVDGCTPFQIEYRLKNHRGEYRWLLDRGVPMVAENRLHGYIGACVDIHLQKVAEQALEFAVEEARAANRAKDDFLAALSHELRTPLTPILLAASQLERDAGLRADVHQSMMMIRKNVELEASLIDDLLDASRITQGRLSVTLRPSRLVSSIRRAIEMVENEAVSKGQTLRFAPLAGLSAVHVMADEVRMLQLLCNLLRNAVKFTPTEGVIEVTVVQEEDHITVSVRDNGRGITEEEMETIFSPFKQGDGVDSAHFGGLGLGLGICTYLAREHGGRLWAESPGRGQGAVFHLELPVAASPAPAPHAAGRPPGPVVPKSILLVEDHDTTRANLAIILQKRGHEVVLAAGVEEALALASERCVDLLISDLGLPDGSGLDIMRTLAPKGVRGIAVSGYGMSEDIAECLEAGFSLHLCKPITISQLEEAIAEVQAQGHQSGAGEVSFPRPAEKLEECNSALPGGPQAGQQGGGLPPTC